MYNFIQIKPNGNLLSIIDSTNTPRYMCFSNKMDAIHCVKYMSKYRSDRGYFPRLDLTISQDKMHEINMKSNFKKRTASSIEKFLSIHELSPQMVDELCSENNINLFNVHSFAYIYDKKKNEMKILMAAQELNGKPDSYKYIRKLDELLEK